MTSSYPIYPISAQPEWIEQMGSKPKFWFRRPDDGQQWLFKFSREGTGEDWAEKIAAEIAGMLDISAPGVELAVFDGRRERCQAPRDRYLACRLADLGPSARPPALLRIPPCGAPLAHLERRLSYLCFFRVVKVP